MCFGKFAVSTFCEAVLALAVWLLGCLSRLGCFLYPGRSLQQKKRQVHTRKPPSPVFHRIVLHSVNTFFLKNTNIMPPCLCAWQTRTQSEWSCDLVSCSWQAYMHAVRKGPLNVSEGFTATASRYGSGRVGWEAGGLYCFAFEGVPAYSFTWEASDNQGVWAACSFFLTAQHMQRKASSMRKVRADVAVHGGTRERGFLMCEDCSGPGVWECRRTVQSGIWRRRHSFSTQQSGLRLSWSQISTQTWSNVHVGTVLLWLWSSCSCRFHFTNNVSEDSFDSAPNGHAIELFSCLAVWPILIKTPRCALWDAGTWKGRQGGNGGSGEAQ